MADVTLHPVTMVKATRACIYAPSRLRPAKRITEADFLAHYADHARPIRVSFEADGVSNPRRVTAYGCGLDCWYIVV